MPKFMLKSTCQPFQSKNVNRRPCQPHLICHHQYQLKIFFSRINTSGIPTPNPSQKPQQALTLSWCSGAHHSRQGGTVTTKSNDPPPWVLGNLAWDQVGANWPHHILCGKLAPFGVLWPFGHITFPWPFMA
ncbi:hypothetical protein O181_076453 [Austropuccinia psidii MF-1]|uniref:Uncharacterized protein n=1 Tax=Austropuccinia psidii MF-1 TaxID=1389203 RepID=A0A9Q3ICT1_9BASI|nr:hypothetical protein [Austropuccinia psidii MF-1]